MSKEITTIESLIKGGLIGAFIGSFLLKDKEEGAWIGGVIGAIIASTTKANQEAQNTNIPVYVEENGKLYAVSASGQKKFIKHIAKPTAQFPDKFELL